MKHLNLVFIFLLQASISFAQTPNFEWVHTHGGADMDLAVVIATDSQNNVYTAGYFHGTVDFDPGPGVTNLNAGLRQTFIQKLNPAGDLVWVKTFPGYRVTVASIAIDPSDNIIIGGYFYYTVDIPVVTGTGSFSATEEDALIFKMNPDGDFLWAKSFGNAAIQDKLYSLATDDLGNIYSTGHFGGICDFDPGAGTANQNSMSDSWDIFVQKLSPAGDYLWAEKIGGIEYDKGSAITVTGNTVLVTGSFQNDVDFDISSGSTILTCSSADNNADIFLLSLTTDGAFNWVKSLTGQTIHKVLTDHSGDIYLTGPFYGNMDADPGPGISIINSGPGYSTNFFIVKLTATGDFIWARIFEGANQKSAYSMAIHPGNSLVIVGEFKGTVDFDCGPGVNNLTAISAADLFIVCLDPSGNYIWAGAFGNTGTYKDVIRDVIIDNLGNIYTVGGFKETVDFDCGPGVTERTTSVDGDMFIQKHHATFLSVNENSLSDFKLYPNPASSHLTISSERLTNCRAVIYNSIGMIVAEKELSDSDKQLDVRSLSAGSYVIKLTNESGSYHQTFIKIN